MQTTPQPFVPSEPLSGVASDHSRHPRCKRVIKNPDGEGWSGSASEGPYMRMQVKVAAGTVTAVAFVTYPCATAVAAGSYAASWAQGRTVSSVQALTSAELTSFLGGLPKVWRFCADLAVDALHAALPAAGAISSTQ